MASLQFSSSTRATFFLVFLLLINALALAIPLSGRSTTTRADLPCISKCLSDSSASVCQGSTIDTDTCLCAMVASVAPKATFANCVESCNKDERIKLAGICGPYSNSGQQKAVNRVRETGPILANTSGNNTTPGKDDGGDDNGSDSTNDHDDDPQITPDVPVRVSNVTKDETNTNSRTTSRNTASIVAGHAGWTVIAAAVATIMLMV